MMEAANRAFVAQGFDNRDGDAEKGGFRVLRDLLCGVRDQSNADAQNPRC